MANFYEEKAAVVGHPVYSLEFAQALDKEDELAEFRSQFIFPDAPESSGRKEVIYLCGTKSEIVSNCKRFHGTSTCRQLAWSSAQEAE